MFEVPSLEIDKGLLIILKAHLAVWVISADKGYDAIEILCHADLL